MTACPADESYCEGARLRTCNSSGDGIVYEAGQDCLTRSLCNEDKGTCDIPACDIGEYACRPDPAGSMQSVVCASTQAAWYPNETCVEPKAQCTEDGRGCFELGMDETEVTRDRYSKFLDRVEEDEPPRESACAWNQSYLPDADCLEEASVCQGDDCGDHPQVCVDWCDALTFCQSEGKTLCGTLGVQTNLLHELDYANDPALSSWANACNAEPPTDCELPLALTTVPVAQSCPLRAPGYDKLRGLTGNVAEWEYSCENSAAGPSDRRGKCFVRGGSFRDLNPACLNADGKHREEQLPEVGFRCCAKNPATFPGLGGGGMSSN